jgi:hypothetical protein
LKLQTCSACKDLPTLQCWSKSHYPFRPIMQIRKKGGWNFKKNLLLRNHWANCNLTFVEWSFDGPLPKLCPVIVTSNQEGRQAKNRKKEGWNKKKIFSSETTEPISTKLCWNDPWVVPSQKCVRQCRPVSKMATITKNRNFFKWPKLPYFKPESAQIWTV